jgi:PPOX class probable F420-dependent enzyme
MPMPMSTTASVVMGQGRADTNTVVGASSGSSPPAEVRARVAAATVGRLATVGRDGQPHVVPVTFALVDERVVTAVDHKPKRTTELQRLRNVAHEPRVTLLVDRYDDDWSQLWWVRLDATAEVVRDEPTRTALTAPLVAKYPQYGAAPRGPVLLLSVTGWTWWSAS